MLESVVRSPAPSLFNRTYLTAAPLDAELTLQGRTHHHCGKTGTPSCCGISARVLRGDTMALLLRQTCTGYAVTTRYRQRQVKQPRDHPGSAATSLEPPA
eukprot:jgi/Tetstr1/430254/TSEL_020082.t1